MISVPNTPLRCSPVFMECFPPHSSALVCNAQKINQRYDEHPNNVNEVPIEPQDFEMIRVVATMLVEQPHDDQGDNASADVQEVQPGDAKKGRTKQTGSPGILEQPHAFTDQPEPFTNMQEGESSSCRRRDENPAEGLRLVPLLRRPDTNQHGQTAGDQNQRHEHDVHNAG